MFEHTLPPLRRDPGARAPHDSARIMDLHSDKHLPARVKKDGGRSGADLAALPAATSRAR